MSLGRARTYERKGLSKQDRHLLHSPAASSILFNGLDELNGGNMPIISKTFKESYLEEFPGIVDQFSDTSRPRTSTPNEEDTYFGGRPSTKGSAVSSVPVLEPHSADDYELSLMRVSCTTVRLRCIDPDGGRLEIFRDSGPWSPVYWVNESRYLARTVSDLQPGAVYRFRLKNKPKIKQVIIQTFRFPQKPPVPTAWRIGLGMPVPVTVKTDFISVSWINPADIQQWEMAIAKGIDGRHGLEPGTWKRCGNVGGQGPFGCVSAGRMFYEFNHLRANTTYFIRIRFRNSSGWSKSSRPLEVSTMPGELASAPTNFLIIHPLYYSYLTLQWQLPAEDGELPLIEALVEYTKVIEGEEVTALEEIRQNKTMTYSAGLNTKIDLPNLEPNTLYQIRVRYRNERGIGASTAVLQAKTLKFWVPRTPKAPDLQYITSTTATVDFEPQIHDRVIEYDIQYSTDRMFKWNFGGNGVGPPIIVNGLQPGTNYFFRVKARNRRGWSIGGADTLAKTKVVARVAPTTTVRVQFLRNTPTTITLQCKSSFIDYEGHEKDRITTDDVTLYRVEYSIDRRDWKQVERKGQRGIIKLNKLEPATHYFIRARLQDSNKIWSGYPDPIIQMATRDYQPGDNILAHGEGPWEKDEGYYPVEVLQALKVGEYYLVRREGGGQSDDVVHKDMIKECHMEPRVHARGRVGRLLTRSTSFTVVEGRHTRHPRTKERRDQKNILADQHEHVNQYLFLQGLPQGAIVQTSKIQRCDNTPRTLALKRHGEKMDPGLVIKNVLQQIKRPIYLSREEKSIKERKQTLEKRVKMLDAELKERGIQVMKRQQDFKRFRRKDDSGKPHRSIISR